MVTPLSSTRSSRVGRGPASPQEVLEALAKYLADPKNIDKLLTLIEVTVRFVIEPYVVKLGATYCRVYRRPTSRNCGDLMKLEYNAPVVFNPHRYYVKMRDQLVEGFSLLEDHPVFSNLSLRRDLLALESRTLTLFFIPQLVRSKSTAANQESLLDAMSQLIGMRRLDIPGALFFLRRSLRPNSKKSERSTYNPNLLANLSFLAYRRFEHVRLSGSDTRRERQNLGAIRERVIRHPELSRKSIARTLVQDWSSNCEVPAALETWAAMVSGAVRYDVRAITMKLR